MPAETIIYLAAVLITSAVIVKILTTSSIAAQRRELAQLEKGKAGVSLQLQSIVEQRTSAADLLSFHERRLGETLERIASETVELESQEEEERKHLAHLGYDDAAIDQALELGNLPDDADMAQGAPPGGEEPAETGDPVGTFVHADAPIEPNAPVVVIPTTLRDPDKLFLPDALVTELLGRGANVVDRFKLNQHIEEAGEDLESILTYEQYFRLGTAPDIRALIVVNTLMLGSGVGSATCRVVELPSGKILLSTSYEQPGESETSPEFEPLTHAAQVIAEAIGPVLGISA